MAPPCCVCSSSHGNFKQLLTHRAFIAVMASLPFPACVGATARAGAGHNPFRQTPPKSEGMKHMLPQINHCDQSHGCTANQWSEALWKSSPVPDVLSNDYVVTSAKGNQKTSRNLEQRACQFSTLIKHTQVAQWYDASRAGADILWYLLHWTSRLPLQLCYCVVTHWTFRLATADGG